MEKLYIGKRKYDLNDVNDCIEDFFDLYEKRPIRENYGGMNSAHMFWVWYVMKKEKPRYVIESGVFRGQSTWLLTETCPDSKIFSIDPRLDAREYINDDVKYFEEDFSLIEWDKYLEPKDTIVFFDDHQNAYNRLLQMKWMGF